MLTKIALSCLLALLSNRAFAIRDDVVMQTPDCNRILSLLHENSISYTLGFLKVIPDGDVSCFTIYDGPDEVPCMIFTNHFFHKAVLLDSTPMEVVADKNDSQWARRASFDMAGYVKAALACTNSFDINGYVSSVLRQREEYARQKKNYDYGLAVVATVALFVEKITGSAERGRRKHEQALNETRERYAVQQISIGMKREDVEYRLGKPLAQTQSDEGVIFAYGPPDGYPSELKDSCTCGILYKNDNVDTIFAGRFFDFRLLDDPSEIWEIIGEYLKSK